jgi:hypothetical protein
MKLPQKLPGTFTLNKKSNLPNNAHPEDLKIAYHFDCYIEGLKFEVFHSKEVIIKQFLFTENEIEEDLKF